MKVSGYDYYLKELRNENNFLRSPYIYKEKREIQPVKFLASVDIEAQKLTIFNQIGKNKNDRENIEIFDTESFIRAFKLEVASTI